ncbi:hypothetical protein [Paenibacillus camelliae]|uniref:hypothetical protein n=1 Tax=Paenibacillus camelliae TaxID=512410 RepID=UPI00203F9DA7|nr:hypothetical protein [Paenibacillus camelliae]MCM3634543.1 hypothetical protein [Paenibacillus camelliae]
MKKLIIVLLATLLLAACGDEAVNSNNGTTNGGNKQQGSEQGEVIDQVGFSDEELVLSTKAVQGDYELSITTDKLKYAVDEPIKVYAELVYKGEQEIEIGHAMYPVGFSIKEHTRNIEIDGAMPQPYIVTLLKKDQPVTIDYTFTGGFSEQDDPDYIAFVKELTDDQLPEGRYTITAHASFLIHGSEPSEAYDFNTSIHFIVE